MSKAIVLLKIVVVDKYSKETKTAWIRGNTANGRYDVAWEEKKGSETSLREGTLEKYGYEVVSLTFTNSRGNTTYIPFNSITVGRAWSRVDRFVKRMQLYTLKGRTAQRSGPNYVHNQRVHHSSMREVVERYHSYCDAVYIFPGSMIDNKLKEAYSSRRVKENPEESEKDEQTAAS